MRTKLKKYFMQKNQNNFFSEDHSLIRSNDKIGHKNAFMYFLEFYTCTASLQYMRPS